MTRIIDPGITALLLYSDREVNRSGSLPPYRALETTANLSLEDTSEGCRSGWKQLPGGEVLRADWTLAHDTHLLRLGLQQTGEQSPETWANLQTILEQLLREIASAGPVVPWAATRIYSAVIQNGLQTPDLAAIASAAGAQGQNCDSTPFGWLWNPDTPHQPAVLAPFQRSLILLIPEERADRVDQLFMAPLSQGLARIELYLQKSLHHARQHEAVRGRLETARVELQESMLLGLRAVDLQQIHREPETLNKVSRQLMVFLAEKAHTEVLLNSLKSNIRAFQEHLERIRLDTPVYSRQTALLNRAVEQLESDLANAEAISQSTYAFQDIQRSIEGNRLERAGVLLGAAAAVLAGLAIFNNFLDIWNLAVEKSGMTLPDPWLRMVLGAAAAIFWPLGAYWAVKRQVVPAMLALAAGVASITLAIIFTVMANP